MWGSSDGIGVAGRREEGEQNARMWSHNKVFFSFTLGTIKRRREEVCCQVQSTVIISPHPSIRRSAVVLVLIYEEHS